MLNRSLRNLLILPCSLIPWLVGEVVCHFPVQALPGQSTEEVAAWIKAHPTLRPTSGEKLTVIKSDTAAQRFTFQASVLAPGKVMFTKNPSNIRHERMTMFDAVNGVTLARLEEILRVIYSLDIYQDYNNAQVVYQYPTQTSVNAARLAKRPLQEALRGELRVGDRFAYWIEIPQPKQGKAISGQISVLLKSDVDKLQTELKTR
jgi:hypothetical protein